MSESVRRELRRVIRLYAEAGEPLPVEYAEQCLAYDVEIPAAQPEPELVEAEPEKPAPRARGRKA